MPFNRPTAAKLFLSLSSAVVGAAPALAGEPTPADTAQDWPQLELVSDHLHARVYLPDAEQGFYRGTRFDWSGMIAQVTAGEHQFFGPWVTPHDPLVHDAATGPAQEFDISDPPGYDAAAPGESFLKIGVGHLERLDAEPYRFNRRYPVLDGGRWQVEQPDARTARFRHDLPERRGYGYRYTKTLRLLPDQPVLVIEHTLENTGTKTIQTMPYHHNFLNIDDVPVGSDYQVRFTFAPRRGEKFHRDSQAELEGRVLRFTKPVPPGRTVYAPLEGFADLGAEAHRFEVVQTKTGAGVVIEGDRPLSQLTVYAGSQALCPEPFVDLRLEPGQQVAWTSTYHFFTLKEDHASH